MNSISALVNWLSDSVIWGPPMIIALFSFGVYITVRTKFFQITRIKLVFDETIKSLFKPKNRPQTSGSITQLQAITTALAATIGTGNIAGVASAIMVGGPGAVFWMWVSAFFGMMTAFAENVLGIFYRERGKNREWSGGAMYYIKNGLSGRKKLKKIARPLAVSFAVSCIFASFGMGNMIQINTVSGALKNSLKPVLNISIPPIFTGLILAVVLLVITFGGVGRIGKVTEKLVPFMAGFYMVGTMLIFLTNFKNAPLVFGSILRGAFGINSITGSVLGITIKKAVDMGFRRGVFSNEAGLGSSVIVHSASDVREPVIQGMWGIFAVFFDTIIGCSLTAFAILSSGVVDLKSGASLSGDKGAELVARAFSTSFGEYAGLFIAISTVFFAFSTVIGWSYYGQKAVGFIFGDGGVTWYRIIFCVMAVFGAVLELDFIWTLSDMFNGLMAVPNLIAIFLLSDKVIEITKNYLLRKVKNKSYIPPLFSFDEKIQKEMEENL